MNYQKISLAEMIAWARMQHTALVIQSASAMLATDPRQVDVAAAVVRTLEALSKDQP